MPTPYTIEPAGPGQVYLTATRPDGTTASGNVMEADAAYYQKMADHLVADPEVTP